MLFSLFSSIMPISSTTYIQNYRKCVFNTYFILSHLKHLQAYLFTNITKQSNVSVHCTFWQYIFWVFLAIGCIFLFCIELNKKKDYCGPILWLTQSKYHVMFAWSLEIFLTLLFSNTLIVVLLLSVAKWNQISHYCAPHSHWLHQIHMLSKNLQNNLLISL